MSSPVKLSLEELNRISVEDFQSVQKNNFCVLLDDIRSMNNVGSVFRTGDAFLIEKLYLCGITATPPHRDIEKTAIGATQSVAWEYREDAAALAKELQAAGWKLVVVEQTSASISLQNFKPARHEKYAFVLGNEVFGVNETLVNLADFCLEIPQFGTKHSLNVSVTAGIILWDFLTKTHL